MSRRRQRGVSLIDGLIALAILAFGLLAMTRFQARLLAQGTEAQSRLTAVQMADQLLSLAIVDPLTGTTSNGPCYAVPTAAGCINAQAANTANQWAQTVAATPGLPGGTGTAAWDAATNQLTVTVRWTGKVVQDGEAAETRQVIVTSGL